MSAWLRRLSVSSVHESVDEVDKMESTCVRLAIHDGVRWRDITF